MMDAQVKKAERQMRKVAVRKAGPVRMTSEIAPAYIPWYCLISN